MSVAAVVIQYRVVERRGDDDQKKKSFPRDHDVDDDTGWREDEQAVRPKTSIRGPTKPQKREKNVVRSRMIEAKFWSRHDRYFD